MENALRANEFLRKLRRALVLILVLMENALRALRSHTLSLLISSLNPCFNGKCSQRAENKSNYLSVT